MKYFLGRIITAIVLIGIIASTHPVAAQAAAATVQSKVRCGVGMKHHDSLTVNLTEDTDYIENLRTSSKYLTVKCTYQSGSAEEPYAEITFYATKKGTYTMKFDVYKANGKKRKSYSVKVYASGSGNALQTIAINGKKIAINSTYSHYTAAKSAKIKFGLATGCKIKKITVYQYDQNGEHQTSIFKNGSNITFGKYGYSAEYTSKSWSRSLFAYTEFEITYYDSFDKQTHTVDYTIYTKATRWY
jgi:hypothetical protein